ncbi:DUF4840 domain-containing protein [Bacteroides sp. An19]|uniref:DUF4840 domain-containing protein n=1 Tax=Bacteroides sp. An19 TaxID=1965580 RepID=UPI0011221DDD|nr:DUF4840 domain-containing protein [Bacteroides sp. An19]
MKTRYLLVGAMLLSLCCFMSCNKDEDLFSRDEIQRFLFNMKDDYYGTVEVICRKDSLTLDTLKTVARSRDSLMFIMPLEPIAKMVSDKSVAQRLCDIGEITVTAGYEFLNATGETYTNFRLYPEDAIIYGGLGAPPTIRIVFSSLYDGRYEYYNQKNYISFNIAPAELWVNGEKYETFQVPYADKIVYHFEGETK